MQSDHRPWWRDHYVWSISLSVLALVVAVAALVKFSGVNVQWGTVADWSAAVGSILAAVVAVGIAVHGNQRQDRREAEEQQKGADRARRRASRVEVKHSLVGSSTGDDREAHIIVKNGGDSELFELLWLTPLLVTFTSDGHVNSAKHAVGATVFVPGGDQRPLETSRPRTVPPGGGVRVEVPCPRVGDLLPVVTELVTYIDADGYRIGRIYRRNNNPNISAVAHPEWAVVDDDYPASAGDLLGELFALLDQATPADTAEQDPTAGG